MKTMKKLLAVIFILALTVSTAVSALAATVQTEAGKTVTVTFTVPDTYAIDGYFEFSNRDLFSSVSFANGNTADFGGGIENDRVYFYDNGGEVSHTAIVNVTVTVKSSAKPGDKCDIVLNYESADVNRDMFRKPAITNTVIIKAAETSKETETSKPETTDVPETQPVTPPQPTPPTPGPGPDTGEIDYTELLRQIAIAEGLNENEYTKDSWDAMIKVLEEARALRTSNSQEDVDNGAKALEKAIAALVKVDYSKLNKAVEEAKGLDACAHGKLWFKLFDALVRADAALKGRDQKVIDDLAAEIEGLIEEIKKDCPNCDGKTTEVIKEVEVLPSDPYCNIKMHKVWPILFFISLGINVVLAGLIIGFFAKRKKNQKDDTPLVDYDIEDDE